MNDPDLDRLAALWNQPDEVGQAELEALARKARQRARLSAYIDITMAVLIAAVCVIGVFLAPRPATIVAALSMMAMTFWLNWKRRLLRQMSRTLDASDRSAFLTSSVRNARADLRRATFGLVTFPPFILLAVMFKLSVRDYGNINHPLEALAGWATSTRGIVSLSLMACFALWMMRSRLKSLRELRRLEDLRQDYDEEAKQERGDAG